MKRILKRIRYNRGSIEDTMRAAKTLQADVYVYPTPGGLSISYEPPYWGLQYIFLKADGTRQMIEPDFENGGNKIVREEK